MNGENFGKAAASYIRDDIHWGSDLDVLKEAFEAALENEDCIEYLDVGCGPGFHIGALRAMYPDASITGVDFSAQMLRILRERVPDIETVFADIVHDAVPGTYNVVSLLNNSLGNVEYDHGFAPQLARKMTMDNIRSSLRSDGSLVLSVYNREKLPRPGNPRRGNDRCAQRHHWPHPPAHHPRAGRT